MAFCRVVQAFDPPSFAKSAASVFIAAASPLIFAARFEFIGALFATETICKMLIRAGAAAASMESSVDTQAVEHPLDNKAKDNTTIRTFFIKVFLLCTRRQRLTSLSWRSRMVKATSAPQ